MRKNGWNAPFHILQIMTWFVFPSIMALFFVFYTTLLDTTTAYVGSVIYALLCLITVVSVVVCTATDPSDDLILRPSTAESRNTRAMENQVYCNVCMQYVHKESRHCRLCDKCVAVFDHHCKWLNNCVGQKNYRYFLGSVVGATLMLAVQCVFGAYLLWQSYSSEDAIRRRSASAFGCSDGKDASGLCANGNYAVSLTGVRAAHITLLAFLVPWCFLIAQLAFFHFQLCIENITTYDYIVRKRKRQLARDRENSAPISCWAILGARVCCQPPPVDVNKSADKTEIASRVSQRSIQSEEEEQAAIEAEVDEDLEVMSARSGEVNDRRGSSSQRNSRGSQRTKRNSFIPVNRGFGLHVNLSQGGNSDFASTGSSEVLVSTPTLGSHEEISYLQAPYTPQQSPRSPRSDPESAYLSDGSEQGDVGGRENDPLSAIAMTSSSSMVMYGRPMTQTAPNNIV